MPAPVSPGLILGNKTRLDHVTQIAAWLGSENSLGLQKVARFAFEQAIQCFNGYLWKFNRVTQSITLLDQDNDYSLNTDWAGIMSANISDTNGEPSAWLPFKEFAAVEKDVPQFEASNATGVPSFLTVISPETDAVVYVFPMPITGNGAGRILRLRYFKRITIPTSDGESMRIPQDMDNAIFWRAVHTFIAMRGGAVRKLVTAEKQADKYEKLVLHNYQDYPDKDYLEKILML